jgi:hypothetical protein
MKILVQFCLALGLAVTGLSLAGAGEARAQGVPECIDSDKSGNPQATAAWWNRRTPEQQKYIRELPCNERYIPMVCVFLWDPDLRGCTNNGVAEYRADKACTAEGYELLSAEHAACKERFKKTFVPPFPNPTS